MRLSRTSAVTKAPSRAVDRIKRIGLLADQRFGGVCMNAGIAPARQTRAQHRHELRTLTYACLEQANGGIVRDINHYGIGLQVVAAVRPKQQLRVRFELARPRLRVETRGEVTWATRSGQCGIRFLDLPPKMARQIDEWIFGNLLEGASLHSEDSMFAGSSPLAGSSAGGSAFAGSPFAGSSVARSSVARSSSALSSIAKSSLAHSSPVVRDVKEANDYDGLLVSSTPVHVIELPMRPDPLEPPDARTGVAAVLPASSEFDWLSQPLSGRGLIWTINTLVVVAALLLFVVVFLTVIGEPPQRPFALATAAALFVAALYWGFFRLFGGTSPGERLARMAGWEFSEANDEEDARFR